MKAMEEAAEDDPIIAERVRMHRYRDPEELYNLETDPDCLNNLINDPEFGEQRDALRAALVKQMKSSNDPILEAYENRESSEIVDRVFAATYPAHSGRRKN